MIVFINGPFGVGKTTTAKLLAEQISRAKILDPEDIGTMLQNTVGKIKPVDDFQEYRAWSYLTVQAARLLLLAFKGPLIIPMTIANKERWLYLAGGMRSFDKRFIAVRLTCSEDELRSRILSRPDAEGPHKWCLDHLNDGLQIMRDSDYGDEIRTDGREPQQVVALILEKIHAIQDA